MAEPQTAKSSGPQLYPDFPNQVRNDLDGITEYVKDEDNAIKFLLKQVEQQILFTYQTWVTANGGKDSPEQLAKIVEQYVHVKLTAHECEIVSHNKYLATILHCEAFEDVIRSMQEAHKNQYSWPGCLGWSHEPGFPLCKAERHKPARNEVA